MHFSSENNSDSVLGDNISSVKSICKFITGPIASCRVFTNFVVQLLGDEPFPVLRPIIEKLLAKDDKNKQRGAGEFIAGVIGGMFSFRHCC